MTEERDSTLAGCAKSPMGDSGVSFGRVPLPRLGAELWPRAGGSVWAACDAVALTLILDRCCSAQGIKGQPGLSGEAARRLLLGQNMKGFHFPCPLRALASLLAAARAGCDPDRSVQGPGGSGCWCCSSGHSQSGL